jgi:hypothetical protein
LLSAASAKPLAPDEKGGEKALRRIFDRLAAHGRRRPSRLPREPEYKLLGGGWNEEGIPRKRHILVDTVEDIGKECDGWEEDEARAEGLEVADDDLKRMSGAAERIAIGRQKRDEEQASARSG